MAKRIQQTREKLVLLWTSINTDWTKHLSIHMYGNVHRKSMVLAARPIWYCIARMELNRYVEDDS